MDVIIQSQDMLSDIEALRMKKRKRFTCRAIGDYDKLKQPVFLLWCLAPNLIGKPRK